VQLSLLNSGYMLTLIIESQLEKGFLSF